MNQIKAFFTQSHHHHHHSDKDEKTQRPATVVVSAEPCISRFSSEPTTMTNRSNTQHQPKTIYDLDRCNSAAPHRTLENDFSNPNLVSNNNIRHCYCHSIFFLFAY